MFVSVVPVRARPCASPACATPWCTGRNTQRVPPPRSKPHIHIYNIHFSIYNFAVKSLGDFTKIIRAVQILPL